MERHVFVYLKYFNSKFSNLKCELQISIIMEVFFGYK